HRVGRRAVERGRTRTTPRCARYARTATSPDACCVERGGAGRVMSNETGSAATSVLLWGGKGSGKSGFVGALWQAGGVAQDSTGRWCISPGDIHDSVTKNYLIDAYTMLREGHRRATMPSSEYPDLRMTARRWVAGSPRASLDLAFTDPAGEYADDPLRARQQ